MEREEIFELANAHGLRLSNIQGFNEMGIDFQVAFATDTNGTQWLLRIPRRAELGEQIEQEKRILQVVRAHLSVQVPDWQIAAPTLVAYPLLDGAPALVYDAQTYAVTWHMPQDSTAYIPTLAKALVELHGIPEEEAAENGWKLVSPEGLRTEIEERLKRVKAELGISKHLESRYRRWLDQDALWPDFTRVVHGDLYAGHVLTTETGTVTGIIDWSTAHVGDIAQDFAGHLTVFGEESLRSLIADYQKQGGQVWDKLYEQATERAAGAPLAYGIFALETKSDFHLAGAKAQLGVG